MEEIGNGIGICGRVMFGGIAEEVITRWGLMSLLVWLGALWLGNQDAGVVWAAIVISGLLFGLGHRFRRLLSACWQGPFPFLSGLSLA